MHTCWALSKARSSPKVTSAASCASSGTSGSRSTVSGRPSSRRRESRCFSSFLLDLEFSSVRRHQDCEDRACRNGCIL